MPGPRREEPLFALNATAPLGGLWSTVADMARYAAYLAGPDDRVVRPETIDEMCRPLMMTDVDGWTGAYGLGFGMGRRGDRVYVGHGGAMPGFLTGLRVRRQGGRRRDRLRQRHARAPSRSRSPPTWSRPCSTPSRRSPRPGCPSSRARSSAELLGLWWSEGSPHHLLRARRRAVVTARRRRPALRDAVCRRAAEGAAGRSLPGGRGPRARRAARGGARAPTARSTGSTSRPTP